jgi:hypothetical protein
VTEAEWLACEKPAPMLIFLRGRVGDRKLRLFACACCRSVLRFVPPGPCRNALDLSLSCADGRATADDLARVRTAAIAVADNDRARSAAAWAACECANASAMQAAVDASYWAAEQLYRSNPRAAEEERRAQVEFLRDIVGDPFWPVRASSLRRAAQNPLVREIAEGIYDGGPQEEMERLAEELERHGCASY